ncbi:hypothetical protein [uncultured Prevotella sp.]|uniref:hypothetical protein n=1 Tax=uncultured Prevotella sp. TaxID=159272 RepID=UPI00259A0E35|nr:hypothetical protein [uncultured Prevotella sp.]
MQKDIVDISLLKDSISYARLCLSDNLDMLLKARKDINLKNRLMALELCLERAEEYLACGYERDAAKFYSLYLLIHKM